MRAERGVMVENIQSHKEHLLTGLWQCRSFAKVRLTWLQHPSSRFSILSPLPRPPLVLLSPSVLLTELCPPLSSSSLPPPSPPSYVLLLFSSFLLPFRRVFFTPGCVRAKLVHSAKRNSFTVVSKMVNSRHFPCHARVFLSKPLRAYVLHTCHKCHVAKLEHVQKHINK